LHSKKRVVFITGCSTGIGYDAVFALSARGHRVIASCRKEDDVKKLQSLGCEALLMDVNDSLSVHNAFKSLMKKTDGHLDVLINNAGYGQAGALEDITRDVMRQQFETNVFGLMELTRLCIPVFRKQGQGRIINISSLLGLVSMPFRGAYNASKYAVEGLCDTLRLELKPFGIKVICIEPGPIESQFRDSAMTYSLKNIDVEGSFFKKQYEQMLNGYGKKKSESIFTKKPDAVIKKMILAMESKHPRAKYPVTIPTHVFAILKRLLSVKRLDQFLSFISKKEMT